ncbi:hypothetical protein QJQ45_024818, partial [Haematococcus lacustris]
MGSNLNGVTKCVRAHCAEHSLLPTVLPKNENRNSRVSCGRVCRRAKLPAMAAGTPLCQSQSQPGSLSLEALAVSCTNIADWVRAMLQQRAVPL